MSSLLLGPLGKVVLLGSIYLLLAVVIWMEARQLAHSTSVRVSPVGPTKSRRNPTKLVLVGGVGPQAVDLATPETLIGRDSSCHVKIPDGSVSSRHARAFSSDGEWHVEDLGSTNGTTLNDRLLTHPVVLRAGDRVGVGRSTFEARA